MVHCPLSVAAFDLALPDLVPWLPEPLGFTSPLHTEPPSHQVLLFSNTSLLIAAFLCTRMGHRSLTGLTWRSAPASQSQCLSSSSLRWTSS